MRPSTFLFFIILLVVVAILLSACGSGDTTYPEPPEQNEPGETRSYEWYPMTTPDGLDLWCFDVIVYRGAGVWCMEADPR